MDLALLKLSLGPLAQQVFDSVVWPIVLAEAAKISDPALVPQLSALEIAIKASIDAELAKL